MIIIIIIIIIIRDTFAAAKSALNDPLKAFDQNVKSCFSKFVNVMGNVFLIREAAFISKEIGGLVFLK